VKRSTERILTTHTGSLPRPQNLLAMLEAVDAGTLSDVAAFESRVRSAVADIELKNLGFANLRGDFLRFRDSGAAMQRHAEAIPGKAQGDGPADAATRSGDQGSLHRCAAMNASKSGGSKTRMRAFATSVPSSVMVASYAPMPLSSLKALAALTVSSRPAGKCARVAR